MSIPSTKPFWALAALLIMAPLGMSLAQNAAPPAITRFLVQATQLRPEKVEEWRALQRNEVIPALKKAGVPSRDTLETVLGNLQEVITLRPLANFAEFDSAENEPLNRALGAKAAEALRVKLRACQVSQQRYVIVRQDALSLTPGGPGGPILVTTTARLELGAGPLHTDLLREQVVPYMQKAKAAGKITGYSVANAAQGSAEQGLRIMTVYYANLAAYDASIADGGLATQVLGAPGAQTLATKQGQLGSVVRVAIRRRVADLSY